MISLPSRGNVRQRTGGEEKRNEKRTTAGSCTSSEKDASRSSRRCWKGGTERGTGNEGNGTLRHPDDTAGCGAESENSPAARSRAAPAPHKSSRFCLEQGGENRWSSPSFSLRLPWLYRRRAPRARGYPVGTHKRSCLFCVSPRFPATLPRPLFDDDERPPTRPCIPGIRPEQREIPPKVAREPVQVRALCKKIRW